MSEVCCTGNKKRNGMIEGKRMVVPACWAAMVQGVIRRIVVCDRAPACITLLELQHENEPVIL